MGSSSFQPNNDFESEKSSSNSQQHTPFIPSPRRSSPHTEGTAGTWRKIQDLTVSNVPSRAKAYGLREASRGVCALDKKSEMIAYLPSIRYHFNTRMPDSITLINHATVLIQLGGVNILTDPIYSWTVSYLFPRMQKPGIPFGELPPIDYILVSHSDYDHLNMRTLRRLRRRGISTLILPKGIGSYGQRAGFPKVIELSHWERVEDGGTTITCVPAKHVSKRKPGDPGMNACAGFVVETNNRSVYFAGDTAYGEFFTEIGSRYNIDVALLPIGAYKPEKWFKNLHLHPVTALQAFQDLRARHLVPFHWGTFWISDEPMEEPPQKLLAEAQRCGIQDKVHILRNGDSFQF